MPPSNTDQDWEELGQQDPYYAVITCDQFHAGNLNEQTRCEFFTSGEWAIDQFLANVRKYIDPAFKPDRALDFGCGVGRLTIPLARQAGQVVGMDVSSAMLREAAANCSRLGVENVQFIQYGDSDQSLSGSFDLILSYIVFQHIPVKRGLAILADLLEHLAAGGVGVIHFTYSNPRSTFRKIGFWMKVNLPLATNFANLLSRRPWNAPNMQMHAYDLNTVLRLLQRLPARSMHLEFTDHEGILGVVLYFNKS